MSREGKLAKNTLILSIGTFLPKLAAFVTLPILTGLLSKEELGTYDLITTLVSFILPVATVQIQTAAFRFLIDARNDSKKTDSIITNIFTFIIPISVAALFILFFLLPGDFFVRTLICLYYFVDIIVNSERQVARGINKSFDYSISAILSALGKMVFAIIFVSWMNMGLRGALIALFLASFISMITITLRTKLYKHFRVSLIDKGMILELIRYSWPMIPNSMSMTVMRVSDRFVVTMFMGLATNAVYSVANKIPSLLTLAQNAFTMAWQENASIASKDYDAENYYSDMFRTIFDLTAGLLGLLICVTPVLFSVFIRGDYDEAYFHMPILFLAMFFYSLCTFLGGIYVAYKDTKSVGITTMAAAACNLAIDFMLIKFIGLYAASGSTLISYILLFVFRFKDVQKLVKVKIDLSHVIFIIGILIVECIFCFFRISILNLVNIILGVTVFIILNKSIIKVTFQKIKAILTNSLNKLN